MSDNNNSAGLTTFDLVNKYVETTKLRQGNPELFVGTKIGNPAFDTNVGGFRDGWYVVLGGAQKSGKSTILMAWSLLFAKNEKTKGMYFSYEMGLNDLGARLLSSTTRIPYNKFRDLTLTDHDWENIDRQTKIFANHNFLWFFGIPPTLEFLLGSVGKNEDTNKIVVDYLQLMRGGPKTSNRQEEVEFISRTMKELAGGDKRLVMAGSQLHRTGVNAKEWKATDFRNTGAIEQDADLAMIVAERTDPDGTKRPDLRDIHVVANRHGPQNFSVTIGFYGDMSTINSDPSPEDLGPRTPSIQAAVNKYINEPFVNPRQQRRDPDAIPF